MIRLWLFVLIACLGCANVPPSVVAPDPSPIMNTDNGKPSSVGVLSLNPRDWPPLVTPHPYALLSTAQGLAVDLPTAPQTINYLTTGNVPRNVTWLTLSVSMTLAGLPQWFINHGGSVPCVRPFLFAHRNNWSLPGWENARWWSNPDVFDLRTPSVTLSVPMTPDRWSNAVGQMGTSQPEGFSSAIADVSSLGVTFGGDFFAHGIGVTAGSARFTITDYRVQ